MSYHSRYMEVFTHRTKAKFRKFVHIHYQKEGKGERGGYNGMAAYIGKTIIQSKG